MDSRWIAVLCSWSMPLSVLWPVLASAVIYQRGFRRLAGQGSEAALPARRVAFFSGLVVLLLATASPIEPMSDVLLSVHMLQHLLLMIAAPWLLAAAAPGLPLLHGVPRSLWQGLLGPCVRSRVVRWLRRRLTGFSARWLVYCGVTWIWHAPALYAAALRVPAYHDLEHATFFAAGLLFFWPVCAPHARRARRWSVLPYLLLAGVQGTLLSAVVTFSDHVIYPHYERLPRVFGMSALQDQALAGALFWVLGSVAYAGLAVGLVPALLRDPGPRAAVRRPAVRLPMAPPSGRRASHAAGAAKWRYGRGIAQLSLFGIAVSLIVDGLCGPAVPALNLASVLPFVYFRALLVLGLLLVGNLFCLACPFVVPARWLSRWVKPRRRWPKRLRSKWLAVALLVALLWANEAMSLWADPRATALLIASYFGAATLLGALFEGTAFCKYVCPIGQFGFVHSLLSPREVRVIDSARCQSCSTHECIVGSAQVRGCGMQLLQARKSSSLDCTFCLDCVRACPHDNVGVLRVVPGAELLRDPVRSGIGRAGTRIDLAALVQVLVFGAFVTAAAMVAPSMRAERWTATALGWSHSAFAALWFGLGLIVLPVALLLAAGALARRSGAETASAVAVATRYSFALLPLGFSMWLAHYAFHFFMGYGALLAALGRWFASLSPQPTGALLPASGGLLRLQIVLLELGLLASLYVTYRIARSRHGELVRAVLAATPFWALSALLFLTGLWTVFQPMAMRGGVM